MTPIILFARESIEDGHRLGWIFLAYGLESTGESWGLINKLREDGWYVIATKGSHRQFKHPAKPGRVTVAGKPSDDLPPGTLNSIFKQAGWKK